MFEFVSATRSTSEQFTASTALGRSQARLAYNPTIAWRVTTENSTGLPTLYNAAIDADNEHDILVFVHDDVFIDDYFIGQRIAEGLRTFDVIDRDTAGRARGAQARFPAPWWQALPPEPWLRQRTARWRRAATW